MKHYLSHIRTWYTNFNLNFSLCTHTHTNIRWFTTRVEDAYSTGNGLRTLVYTYLQDRSSLSAVACLIDVLVGRRCNL